MVILENCEIFPNHYFSYVREYKATLAGGNNESFVSLILRLLQSWEQELKNCGFVCTNVMDLSKEYYYIPHKLLRAKLQCQDTDKE